MAISPDQYLAQYGQYQQKMATEYLTPFQKQMAAMQEQYDPNQSGPMASENYRKYGGQYNAAQAALANAQNTINNRTPSAAEAAAWANKQAAYGLADENIDRLANDPTDAMVRQSLQDVMSGKTTPYNQETRTAFMTGASQQAGAANAQRQQQMIEQAAERGLSANDPSVQAAMRSSQAQQQQGVQDSRLDIAQKANLANFQAQQGATNQLGGYNMQRQNMMTQANQNKQNMLWNQQFNSRDRMPSFAMFMNQAKPKAQ